MEDEVLKIVKMVEEGKISAEEAQKLIEALNVQSRSKRETKGRFLKIRVQSDKDNVNITLPLGLLKFAEKFIPKDGKRALDAQGINLSDILDAVDEDQEDIVNIQDEDETVRIWIE